MADLGDPVRIIEVVPRPDELPFPLAPQEAPSVPEREPEEVPA
jgi:hypothetical protein